MFRNLTIHTPHRTAIYFAFLCFVVFAPVFASAQTVRPLIAELGNPARGRVEYVNDSNFPLTVVVETKSFTVSETGQMSYAPLDPKIKLKLSATSFRIPPQQSYFLFYEASAQDAPAWFVIYAAFSGFPMKTQQGLNVRLELPHTVYLLPKKSLDKSELQITKAEYNGSTKKLTMVLENSGPSFGRVLTSTLIGAKHQEGPGFPIFPNARRIFEYACEGKEPPQKVELEFDKFKIEAAVTSAN
jgi:hypothetical protein